MNHDSYSDAYIKNVLTSARTIAVVGASANAARASNGVMKLLIAKGHKVIPINPRHAGGEILGQTVYASLAAVPGPVDMVDIFRKTADAIGVVREAVAQRERLGLKSVWMQLDIRDDAVAAEAEAAGLKVVMDRCPAIEYRRLSL
ncbi:MAG: CoA-binding protein [Hyphomicrobiaceae bacterium]|nr:CoA-binding protein [Hyphomicrobiaceae bacterium]